MRRLDRYILGDLLRLVLLTTIVLVTVIAFGAAIKPLAADRLLTAGQTMKYVALAIVPMLQFALPFAAGLAGTMSLHRMTSDNEILAASVGGITYRRLLAPVVGLGLALLLLMILLTQSIIPRFWVLLESEATQDITDVFQAAIQRGEPFEFGDRQIFADRVIVERNPPDSDVDTRLILVHVAAADMSGGRIDKDVTAETAIVDIYRRPEATYLKLAMANTVAYNPDAGLLAGAERLEFRPIVITSLLEEDARMMTGTELRRLRDRPDSFGPVVRLKLRLAEALRELELWRKVDRELATAGRIELVGSGADAPRYIVRAEGLEGGQFKKPQGVVEVRDGDRARREFRTDDLRLVRHGAGSLATLGFDLLMGPTLATDLDFPGSPNRREQVRLDNLMLRGIDMEDFSDLPSAELMRRAREIAPESNRSALAGHVANLERRIARLQDEVTGRLCKRYALSTTALLLLVLGATLAMSLRRSQPLVIYLWAFLPSIFDLLLISSGEQMMRDGAIGGGLAVMWMGHAILAGIFLTSYKVLSRH